MQAGDQWWIREPDGKGHTNEGDPNHRLLASARGLRLLRPRSLVGSTVLDYLREAAQSSPISGP